MGPRLYIGSARQNSPIATVLDQSQTPLLSALQACALRPHAPFYAPGHKGGVGVSLALQQVLGAAVFRADLPELPELDNLLEPSGVILQAQELAAAAFGAERTWFLANGSTSGIEAAILTVCRPGDKIILPRNSHQSAIAALILSGALPVFVPPAYDADWDLAHSLTPSGVEAALAQHPDAKAVMLVAPTYHGVCGDVAAIAELAHQHHLPLLVDEAHGPHFGFHPDLPISALAAGADLVVQSSHKVLAAMTQAAMVHVQGDRIDRDGLSRALRLVQSTSPSYLLLASLDAARQQMALRGEAIMGCTLALAAEARQRLGQIPGLRLLGPEVVGEAPGVAALDLTRLTVDVTGLGLTGFAADELLHEQFGVTAELPALRHLTFIISLGNRADDIEQLVQGFAGLARENRRQAMPEMVLLPLPQAPAALPALSPREAFFAASETVAIAQAAHRISAELICPYPPGIPLLLPGESITPDALTNLQQVLAAGGLITGCADPTLATVRVVT